MPGYPCCCNKCRPPVSPPCDDYDGPCLENSIIVLTMVFEDANGCNDSVMSGTWVYHPGLPGSTYHEKWASMESALASKYGQLNCAIVYRLYNSIGGPICEGIYTPDFRPPGFPFATLACVDEEIVASAGFIYFQGGPNGLPEGRSAEASGSISIAEWDEGGHTIELEPWALAGSLGSGCGGADPAYYLNLVSATVTIYGKPCEGTKECPETGPTADFEIEPVPGAGCQFNVNDLSVRGTCDYICVWSDGYVGCGVRPAFGVEGCGEHSVELTLTLIDVRGCTSTVTKTASCCNCDDGDSTCEPVTPSISHSQTFLYSVVEGNDCGSPRLTSYYDMHFEITWDDSPDSCGIGRTLEIDLPGSGIGYSAGSPTIFTIENVPLGYAPNFCVKARVINLSEVFDPEGEDGPLGCEGPIACWEAINYPSYPGNSCWYDPSDCTFVEYTSCCPDWEGCGEEP